MLIIPARTGGIMFFKRLDSGKYRYYEKYYDEEEEKWKQVSITLSSKSRAMQAEAKRLLADKIEDKTTNLFGVSKDLTVEQVKDEFLTIRKMEVKESTYKGQKDILDIFFRQFDKVKLRAITPYRMQSYLLSCEWTSSYRRLVKTLITLFFKYCVKSGYLEENPMDKVVLPKTKKTLEELKIKQEKYLSRNDMQLFIHHLEEHGKNKVFNLLAEFMYYTGLRVGEALALQWKDIDFENGFFEVKHTLSVRKGGEYYLSSPKTLNAYRTVSFHSRVLEILTRLKKKQDTDFVFSFRGEPVKRISFNAYLRKHFARSGIKKGVGFNLTTHVLRHSHISLLAELNVPLKLIMERVGHSDEKTTLEIYTHVTETMREDLRSKLEDIEAPKKHQKEDIV